MKLIKISPPDSDNVYELLEPIFCKTPFKITNISESTGIFAVRNSSVSLNAVLSPSNPLLKDLSNLIWNSFSNV